MDNICLSCPFSVVYFLIAPFIAASSNLSFLLRRVAKTAKILHKPYDLQFHLLTQLVHRQVVFLPNEAADILYSTSSLAAVLA